MLKSAIYLLLCSIAYRILGQKCDKLYEKCENQHRNVVCRYTDTLKGDCRGACLGLTTREGNKELWLGMHNYYRNKIASGMFGNWPKAKNMRQVTWNKYLMHAAVVWLKQCVPESDTCRDITSLKPTGQNYGEIIDFEKIVSVGQIFFDTWIGEIRQYFNTSDEGSTEAKLNVTNLVDKFEEGEHKKVARFAQIINANTFKIGCAAIQYWARDNFTWITRAVCNYGPGLRDGRAIYEVDSGNESCPKSTEKYPESTYKYLCALPGDPKNETPVVSTGTHRGVERGLMTLLLFFSFPNKYV